MRRFLLDPLRQRQVRLLTLSEQASLMDASA
jgi:hypothetical protein